MHRMLAGPGCLAAVAGLLMVLGCGRCQGNEHEPVNRLMVFRDVPKGLDINQPQHLIVRTSYPVSDGHNSNVTVGKNA